MYAVEIEIGGTREISRIFETIRAARKWAKWLATQDFGGVRIMRGGPGGEEVA